jgi:hypothetical protein
VSDSESVCSEYSSVCEVRSFVDISAWFGYVVTLYASWWGYRRVSIFSRGNV